jgi:RimJ/RimL family protein N-acetyltransferase
MELRNATMADADEMLRWKNDPVTRQNALCEDEIPREVHERWMEARLNLPGMWIIEDNGPVGWVRIDPGGEVAVLIAPEHRGRGLAREAVKMAVGDRRDVFARIVDGNFASMRVFEGCGFGVSEHRMAPKPHYVYRRD